MNTNHEISADLIDFMSEREPRFPNKVNQILILSFGREISNEINMRIRNPRSLPPRTEYLDAICENVKQRDSHLIVQARAGCGKTTAIEHVGACFPFANIQASTTSSYCFGALRYYVGKWQQRESENARRNGGHYVTRELELVKNKQSIIVNQLLNFDGLNADDQFRASLKIAPALRLVDLARYHTYTSLLPMPTDEQFAELVEKFNVELPDPSDDISDQDIFDLARQTLAVSNRDITTIDFIDMIHLCLVLKDLRFLWNDLIMVDESQDLSPMEIAAIKKMATNRAQVVFVGDDRQAIYGFRCADVEAIASIQGLFNAQALPLPTCWRCPTSVIKEAQRIVPDIEAAPSAIEGNVNGIHPDDMMKKVEIGDFVLCRTSAPLVETCMNLIRNGKPATMRGRDIGTGLTILADKIKRKRGNKGKPLHEAIENYKESALSKLGAGKEAQYQSLADRIETLSVLAEDCDSFDGLKTRIEKLFSDTDDTRNIVLCSTVHKAKGLEAERVWIIRPDLMPHPAARKPWQRKQESNLEYVAITRATRELNYVSEDYKREKEVIVKKAARKPRKASVAKVK